MAVWRSSTRRLGARCKAVVRLPGRVRPRDDPPTLPAALSPQSHEPRSLPKRITTSRDRLE